VVSVAAAVLFETAALWLRTGRLGRAADLGKKERRNASAHHEIRIP
jgi:hypothetical protein